MTLLRRRATQGRETADSRRQRVEGDGGVGGARKKVKKMVVGWGVSS